MIGVGIGLPFYRSFGAGVDAQAQVHYNRVIADGGVVPSGLSGVNAFFSAVKAIYGTTDINTAISAAYDAHYLGYKLGAGSGTTLGQAAQKLYAPKGIFGGIGTGSAFYDSVGVTSNFINTPSIGIDTNSGMSVDVKVALVSGVTYTSNWICSNDNGSTNRNMFLGFTSPSRTLIVYWSNLTRFASSTIALSDGFDGWIRCSLETSGSDMLVRFFTSLDGITYTQLGATVTNSGGANTFQTSNAPFNITGNGGANTIIGKIYRVIYRNASGVVRADFNPNQYTGANTWTSTTSEVWTVNSTGAGLADVTQTTAASQPLLLAHTGENYWFGSGVTGNFVSTPNAAANQITGDIDCIAYVNYVDNGTYQIIFSKSAVTYAYSFYVNGTGANSNLELEIGSPQSSVISSVSLGASFNGWVRVTRAVTGGIVKFYTSLDSVFTSIGSISWTQNGIDRTLLAGTPINNTSNNLFVGVYGSNVFPFQGKIYRATISNSIGGTPVVDFNPASYNPATSQTQWTSATGEVWTINTSLGTGTGYRGLLVDRSYVMSDGIDDAMVNTFTLATIKTIYNTYKIWDATATGSLFASNNGAEVVDANLTGTGNCLQYDNAVNQITISLTGTGNRYTMRTAVINGANSLQQINNGTAATGTLGTSNSTSMKIFQERNGSFKSKMVFSGMFLSLSADNTTIRTAIYNYIRSINGNSF